MVSIRQRPRHRTSCQTELFCLDEQDLDRAARVMERKHIRRLPVINRDRRMIGMLSLGEVYHAGPRGLGHVMHAVSAIVSDALAKQCTDGIRSA